MKKIIVILGLCCWGLLLTAPVVMAQSGGADSAAPYEHYIVNPNLEEDEPATEEENASQDSALTATSTMFKGNYTSIGQFIGETLIPYAVALASIGAVVMITIAGNTYVSSGGSPEAISEAKEMIVGALLGLAIIIMAGIFVGWAVNVNQTNTTDSGTENPSATDGSNANGTSNSP